MARKGLAGKYIKQAKGDFKKAWRLQRGASSKRTSNPRKRTRSASTPKRKKTRAAPTRAPARRITVRRAMTTAQKVAMFSVAGVGGAMATAAAVGALPIQQPVSRAFAQIGVSILTLMIVPKRMKMVRMASLGGALAGGLGLSKAVMPAMPLMAGNDRQLPSRLYQRRPGSNALPDPRTVEKIGMTADFGRMGVTADFAPEMMGMQGGPGKFLTPADL